MSKGGWKTFGSSCLHPWGFPRSLPCKPHPQDAGEQSCSFCKRRISIRSIHASLLSFWDVMIHTFSFLRFYHPGVIQLGLGSRFPLIWYLASHQVHLAFSSQKFYLVFDIWLPIRSSLHFQLTTFIVHPIRLSLTDFPRIKYLKWDYEELTETQLQVSQYAWFTSTYQGRTWNVQHIYMSQQQR